MKENEEYRVDTRLINLKKECIWIVSKWKWIVAIAIIMSIFAVSWKYGVDYQSNRLAYEEAIKNQENASIDYLSEQMTDNQMIMINRAYSCWKQSIGAEQYLENSILIREDPYEMDIAYIYFEYEDGDKFAVFQYVHSSKFFEDLQIMLGWDTEEQYLRELITDGSESTEYTFLVTAADQEACEALANALINLVSMNCKELVNRGFYLLDVKTDFELVEKYNKVYENWTINSERMASYERLLSVSELAVLNVMIQDYLGRSEIPDEENTEIILAKATINAKMIVYGAISGVILSIIFFMVFYTLSPNIHGKEELFALFHLPVIGVISGKKTDIEYVATNIVLACKKNMVSTVYMSGTKVSELSEDVYKQIEATFQASQIKLIRGEDITKNAKSLTQMVQAGACIIIERDENSKCTVIADEMNICSRNQVQVLGAILLKA